MTTVFLIGCQRESTSPSNRSIETGASAKPVEVIEAKQGEIRSELNLSGTVDAKAKVTIFPRVAGQIINLPVEVGQQVAKGDLLAVVEYEELELNLRQAKASYRAAKAVYQQAQQLAKIQVESQVVQAQAGLSAAEISLQQVRDLSETRTKSQIEQAEAGLASLRANLEKIKRGAREEDRKQAEASVNQAKANLISAENNSERMQQLFQDGAISLQSFENAETQLNISKAQYQMTLEQQKLIKKGAQEEDIEAMEAQVQQAKAALDLARASSETKSWEKDIALAESQIEAAKAGLKTAQLALDVGSWEVEIISAETRMVQAQTALDLAKKRLDDASIRASISGVISARNLDLGGMAALTTPVFEIVEMDQVKVIVNVIESDLNKIELGRQVTIEVDALSEAVEGQISQISPTLDLASRSVKVEIRVDNRNVQLKPGMFAKVRIPVDVRENVVLIPRSALIESGEDSASVFTVDTANKGQRRLVQLGLIQNDVVEVGGIKVGEKVIVAGQFSLKAGELVKIVN